MHVQYACAIYSADYMMQYLVHVHEHYARDPDPEPISLENENT